MPFVLAHPKSKVSFSGSPVVHLLKGVYLNLDVDESSFETRCGIQASNGDTAFTPVTCIKCKPSKEADAGTADTPEQPSNT